MTAQIAPRTAPRPGLVLAVLAIGGCAYAGLQSLVVPALPTLQKDLDTTPTGVAWIFTTYLLAASVATPIAGRLGDMFGKKRTLLVVLVFVGGGTALAAFATTLPVMILARVIQGLGGAIFPLAFGIIRDEFPRERVASGIGLISGLLGIGAGLGIVLAGPILEHLNYHWLFWIPLGLIAVTIVATIVFIPESPIRAQGSVNWTGAILLSLWLDLPPARDQRGTALGLALGAGDRPDRPRGRRRLRLGQGRVAIAEPTRRHAHDAAPGRLDDEPDGLPDRVRDVQLIRADPAVRRDAHVDRLRLRRRP